MDAASPLQRERSCSTLALSRTAARLREEARLREHIEVGIRRQAVRAEGHGHAALLELAKRMRPMPERRMRSWAVHDRAERPFVEAEKIDRAEIVSVDQHRRIREQNVTA